MAFSATRNTPGELPYKPLRYTRHIYITVPATDFRCQFGPLNGITQYLGNGTIHHDLVNFPFHGPKHGTAVIAHPLNASDLFEIQELSTYQSLYLKIRLRAIQGRCQNDARATQGELEARQKSIGLLGSIRRSTRQDPYRSSSSAASESHGPKTNTGTAKKLKPDELAGHALM